MKKKQNMRTVLITKSPTKLMVQLSLPSIMGMIVIGLYSFMDGIFVGQMVGAAAMGAVAIAYPFTFINSGIATLVGMGSASVLSRAVGEKNQKTIDAIMGNLICLTGILSLIITVLGIIFARQLLLLSGAQGQILDLATGYLRIVFVGSLFVNFAQSSNMIMRGEGLLKKAMIIMGAGALLNIILDPLMISIMKRHGAGIEGAAYATLISQFFQAIAMLVYYLKYSKDVKIHSLKINRKITANVFKVGISAMLMQIMSLIQQTLLYNSAARYGGENSQILMAAALRVLTFGFIPLWGISQGFQPAAGTNYGAKEYERVKKITTVFTLGATALAALFFIPVELFPATILSFFITDPDLVATGVNDFRILFLPFIFLGIMIIAITLFQALGKGGKAAFLVIARQIVFFIPLVIFLPKFFGLGIHGVWLASAICDGLVVFMSCLMMKKQLNALPKNK